MQGKTSKPDYKAVRDAIAEALEAPDGYDDGNFYSLFLGCFFLSHL